MENTYHVVLERPQLRLYGALPCDLIILISHLIIVVRVW
jgi:hypothetical protein